MITGIRWYNSRAYIGIVQVVPQHEEEEYRMRGRANFKYYIGLGNGRDEKYDAEYIAEWGAAFDSAAGDVIFNVQR